ncbi:hypothetical protein A6P54_03360 [Bacillus sp. MKU004]|nr:hypothetical protein A6P54_03360 [Bacillus sp. MKU004]
MHSNQPLNRVAVPSNIVPELVLPAKGNTVRFFFIKTLVPAFSAALILLPYNILLLKPRVEWSGRHLTPTGDRGKVETPQAERRGGSTSSPRKASACSAM